MDRFLAKVLPQASGGFLHKMLRKKNIKLNGQKAEGNEKLKSGDKIQIFFSEETFEKFRGIPTDSQAFSSVRSPSAEKKTGAALQKETPLQKEAPSSRDLSQEEKRLRKAIKVLYKDSDLVILHKPSGLLSQKASQADDSLNDYLLELCRKEGWVSGSDLQYFRPSIANRLDRNTSGIVLCGITTKGLQMLSEVLRDRSIAKYYMAIVSGHVSSGRKVKGYLQKDREKNVVHFSELPIEGSVAIETEYQVLKAGKEASLLRIRLITGKSHQIRAHLASLGYPILGDYKYGSRNENQKLKSKLGISYQMLHSCEIDFGSHLHGLVIKDPLPESFQRVLRFYQLEDPGSVSKK